MITTVSISLSAVDEPVCRSLPAGVRHVSEVMPAVLAQYGLASDDEPDSEPPVAIAANDFFDVAITALESVLAT